MEKPRAEFKMSGDVEDFERIDNLYRVLKREGEKLFKNWMIEMDVKYQETEAGVKR